jgi:4-hydroxy-3-methylbut-2-enyl diphosphate reductase
MNKTKYNITVAKTAGFCFGVDRAIKLVYNELSSGNKTATLGEIIHNPSVVKELAEKGVRTLNDVSEALPDETVIIRSHG